MKMIALGVCFSFMFLGCDMQDIIDKTNKIENTIFENCNCDKVQLIEYIDEVNIKKLHVEIIGVSTISKKETVNIINNSLKKEIKDYCEIDLVLLEFINKGKSEEFFIKHCELQE